MTQSMSTRVVLLETAASELCWLYEWPDSTLIIVSGLQILKNKKFRTTLKTLIRNASECFNFIKKKDGKVTQRHWMWMW